MGRRKSSSAGLVPVNEHVLAARLQALEARLAAIEQRLAQLEMPRPLTSMPPPLPPSRPPTRPPGWVPVFHKSPECRGDKIAFYLIRPFSRTEKGDLDCMRTGPDLHKPTPGEASICTSCDAPFEMQGPDLDWSHALIDEHGNPPPPAPLPPSFTRDGDPTGRLDAVMDAIGRAKSAGLLS